MRMRVSTELHMCHPQHMSSGAGLAMQTHRYGRIRSNGFSTPYLHADKYGLDCSACAEGAGRSALAACNLAT